MLQRMYLKPIIMLRNFMRSNSSLVLLGKELTENLCWEKPLLGKPLLVKTFVGKNLCWEKPLLGKTFVGKNLCWGKSF